MVRALASYFAVIFAAIAVLGFLIPYEVWGWNGPVPTWYNVIDFLGCLIAGSSLPVWLSLVGESW